MDKEDVGNGDTTLARFSHHCTCIWAMSHNPVTFERDPFAGILLKLSGVRATPFEFAGSET